MRVAQQYPHVAHLRNDLLNQTLLFLGSVGLVLLAASIARMSLIGWQSIFWLHITVVLLCWLCWFGRLRLPYAWRLSVVLGAVCLIGLAGYVRYGPASSGAAYMVLFLVLSVLFLEGRLALLGGLAMLLLLLLIATAAVNQRIHFNIDYQSYAHSMAVWILLTCTVAMLGGAVAFLVWRLLHQLMQNEQHLTEANARLAIRSEEALAATLAKSRFLATMSHEIRTPLNGILCMAQLLEKGGLHPNEQREYARVILHSGQSLLTLLNDVLDLSKVEAGKMVLEPVVCEPQRIVQDVQTLFGAVAQAKGLELTTDTGSLAGQVYKLDLHRLRQMLSNLVDNAIKFTEQGSVRIEAREVGRAGHMAMLEFAVTDTGIGIEPEAQQRLFQAFSQADSSITREFGGSGLGLSIVQNLAQLMAGAVGLDSSVGQGARFWFRVQVEFVDDVPTVPQPIALTVAVTDAAVSLSESQQLQQRQQVQAILAELLPLVRKNRFSAIAKFAELEQLLAATAAASELVEVGQALRVMDFEQAYDRLLHIAAQHHWMPPTP